MVVRLALREIRDYTTESVVASLEGFLAELELEFERIKTLQLSMVNDPDLSRLATIPESLGDFERATAMNRLRARLAVVSLSSEYIKDVSVYLPSLGRVVSAVGSVSEADDQQWLSAAARSDLALSKLIYEDAKLCLRFRYPPHATLKNRQLHFVIEIEIMEGALERSLTLARSHQSAGSLLYSPALQLVITDGDETEIGWSILREVDARLPEKKQGWFYSKGGDYLTSYAASDYLGMVYLSYMDRRLVSRSVSVYRIWFWVLTAALVAVFAVFSIAARRFVHKPLSKLVEAFGEVEQGNLDVSADHRGSDEFAYLFRGFNSMVDQLRRLIDQVLKQKILAQRSELKQLQSQINPHFLYNSFFILHGMVLQKDYANLEKFSRQLGAYYQFLTRGTADEIPLQREVDHARTYAEIQARRFRNRIRLEFEDCPGDASGLVVPRLIIQPLLENAFEHGLRDKMSDGVVRVRFDVRPEQLVIEVSDNGEEIDERELARMRELLGSRGDFLEHTGLANVHRRLQLKFGKSSGLSLRLGRSGGLAAELTIVHV